MEEQNNTIASVDAPVDAANVQPAVDAAPKKKKVTRSRKKVVAPEAKEETKIEATPEVKNEEPTVENKTTAKKTAKSSKIEVAKEAEKPVEKPATKPIPKMPTNLVIRDFCDLANSGGYIPLLSDQQIQQLTYEEAYERNLIFEAILSNVLDYDIVLSDTNIWLELLVGHTSSHSDPRVNARLMFERQLEFLSKMCKKIGGKFTIMSETYEEVDRFATMQEPTDYKLADWKDPALCLNVAARLAKRLMLYQQKENRLRIEGIGSESHHGSFADPAIIRRTVELFAMGKKVLLLTNDASVAIRSLGMCDDLQRTNEIGDAEWREIYEPQRPMVLTMDDLKLLDQYTRQYHFLTLAAGRQWMQDVQMRQPTQLEKPLSLWIEGFRPGDRRERRSDKLEQQKKEYEKQRQEQARLEQERKEQERKEQARLEQERREAEKQARREEQERREQENRERKEQARLEQQRREEQRRADRERAAAEKAARIAAEEEARRLQASQSITELDDKNNEVMVAETAVEDNVDAHKQELAPAESTTEEVQTIELPPLSPEMMELMGPSSSEKKRTRRGGRRRKTTEPAEQK
jgi:flagellar biosynthesis GTPase FlhF